MESAAPSHQGHLPTVSVITTLLYPRQRPLDCLSSWTHGQQFPQDQIELVVVVNGRRSSLENAVRQILRPQDRLIATTSTNEMELYDIGARAAHGEWLMFTEPHCVAEPGCLKELLDFVIPRQMSGACVRTLPTDDPSPVARMEARMYLEDDSLQREGDWRKFTKRGTLVKKQAYEAAGGFNKDHLRYAETTFAASLHQLGFVMGFAPKAAITHFNSTDLGELLGYVWEYRRKELLTDAPLSATTDGSREIDPSISELMSRRGTRRRLRAILKNPLRKALRHPTLPESKLVLRTVANLMLPRTINQIVRRPKDILRSAWRFAAAWVAFQRSDGIGEARYASYKRIWQSFGDLSVSTLFTPRQSMASTDAFPTGRICEMGPDAMGCCAGFHALENIGGTVFRWSNTVAVIRFKEPVHKPVVALSILSVRPLKAKQLTVLWNKTRLSFEKSLSTETRWVFAAKKCAGTVPPVSRVDGEWLTLICPPLPSRQEDTRVLGLPLVSVEVQSGANAPDSLVPHGASV